MNDKREGFLKELKPGDVIAIKKDSFGSSRTIMILDEVTMITPTGIIRTGDRNFDPNGIELGNQGHKAMIVTKEEYKKEEKERLDKMELLRVKKELEEVIFYGDLSINKLQQMLKIAKEEESQ